MYSFFFKSKNIFVSISVFSLLLIGTFDYLTGIEFSFSLFYLLPITIMAWYVGFVPALMIVVLSMSSWLVTDFLNGTSYSSLFIPFWNTGIRIGVFIIFALLVTRIRNFNIKLEKEVEDRTAKLLTEITERKKIEISLIESEKKYRDVVENAIDIIYTVDKYGYFNFANKAGLDSVGFSLEELKQKRFTDIAAPEYKSMISRFYLRQFLEKINTTYFEFPFLTKKGERIWFGQHSSLIYDKDEYKGFHVIGRDITDRLKAEELIKESEKKYKTFFDNDITGDFVLSIEGKIIDCNPAFIKMFNYKSREDAINSDLKILFPDIEDLKILIEKIKAEKTLENIELEMKSNDGKLLNVIQNVFGEFDENGNLELIRGYLFDDTHRKQLEKNVLQAQKMEGLGKIAGGIAHDFNNILCIVLGYLQNLQANVKDSEKFQSGINVIESTINRGIDLVKQLLTFSRKSNISFSQLNANELIRKLTKLLTETFPRTIHIELQLQKDLPYIVADSNQLHQALLNLSLNSRDAMPNGGLLVFSTFVVEENKIIERFPDLKFSNYICISVSDTGTGMDEKILQRAFEPFFTTKEINKGTGLGLSVLYGIVQEHKGKIDIESTLNYGTTVNIYLPVSTNVDIASALVETDNLEIENGSGNILVVEDEPMLRQLVEDLLMSKGYNVIKAVDGDEGLELFIEKKNEISLVFSDYGLPQMNGIDMMKKIKEIKSGQKFLLASGFLDPDANIELVKEGFNVEFMQKPYDLKKLLKTIHRIITTNP